MREEMQRQSPSGFSAVPVLEWGSHLNHFYETEDDLRDVLVPYFKAGLENNESCLWVTGAPFGANQARSALRAAVSDFDAREARKQIEIRDANEWYAAGAKLRPAEIIAGLLRREEIALGQGYQGLRTNGNCAWVEHGQWADFQNYESMVQKAIRGRRMICSCSYCLDQTQGAEMLDVLERHDFALPRRGLAIEARGASSKPFAANQRVADGFAGAFETIPVAIYTTDAKGLLTYYNEAAARLWGYRPEIGKQRWCGTWKIYMFDGTHVPHDQCPMAVALRTGKPVHGVENDVERPDGTRVPCVLYPTPLFDDVGNVVGGLNMLVDITARRAAEDRYLTLANEMHHRVNNTLATVQAIMGSTMRHARTMEDFQQSFTDRVRALSNTHAMLTKSTQPSISLRELLNNELRMFIDTDDSRVMLNGPDLILPERLAVPVGMAIHELTTNAAKYGALLVLGGTLSVQWEQSDAEIAIHWRECNVPISKKATRIGFGSRLLRDILPKQIDAKIDLHYEADGLDAHLIIPR